MEKDSPIGGALLSLHLTPSFEHNDNDNNNNNNTTNLQPALSRILVESIMKVCGLSSQNASKCGEANNFIMREYFDLLERSNALLSRFSETVFCERRRTGLPFEDEVATIALRQLEAAVEEAAREQVKQESN